MDEWISIRQAAQITGYVTEYVRELARGSRVKAKKVFTVWMVEKNDLMRYKSEQDGRREGEGQR